MGEDLKESGTELGWGRSHSHCLSPRALTLKHVLSHFAHTLTLALARSHVHTCARTHTRTLTRAPRTSAHTLPPARFPGRGAGTAGEGADRTHDLPMADLSFIEDSVAFPEKEEDEEEEEEGVEWGYEEGVEWGLVFPDANGEYQSPINLNSREARYDPSLLDIRLSPNYVVCRDCEVTNDGHTIQVILKSKSVLSGGPLPQGHEFELYEVRFHWGRENQRGSEHTVNFKAFPMELHLIHWNATLFGSIDEAVGKPHGIAIIALFVQIGKEHVGLKAVTEILQDIQYKGKSKTIPCFNPNTLLPDPLLRDYWVYEGSLTIPPCSEGVTWILFRYPLTISQLQIEEFRRLRTHVKGAELVEGCDGILGDNFRPTQPLSDRVIRAAFQ